jgi:DNA (cytosine-5)-methyltransferase 1
MAGKRKGTDDERYLWGEMLRAIQEIKPKYVIAENVFGITNINGGLVFEQVCLDLEAEGYEVQPFIIPAAAKNAPHRRDRCWFIAENTMFSRCVHGESKQERAEVRQQRNTCAGSSDGLYLSKGNATDTDSNGFNQCNSNNEINTSQAGKYAFSNISKSNDNGDATNTNGNGFQRGLSSNFNKQQSSKKKYVEKHLSFRKQGISFSNFPTESPICGGDDGLPSKLDGITFSKWRAESIKGYGNAICPQIAYEIFKQL